MRQQTKTCATCNKNFVVTDSDLNFYDKMGVPSPTFCPDCREQRRLAFRNERALYKRECDLCGKEVVARVSPDKDYPVYCQNCWWSDAWDPMKYGRDYDFDRPFFEQFKDLLFSTPHISILNAGCVNSPWVNQEEESKNCYLNVGGHGNEDSAYNTYELFSNDCFDNFWVWNSELCYESINLEKCYKALFSQDCFNCQEIAFCFDCRNCQNCLGSAGLRHKQYYIFNKPHTKEEYQQFLKKHSLTSYKNISSLKKEAEKIWLSVPHRPFFIVKSNRCQGNFITESKNAQNCWYADKIEDGKHLYIVASLKDCYDCSSFGWGELCYEVAHSIGLYKSRFTLMALGKGERMHASNLEYCFGVTSSNNCFGCCNLKNGEYCILNKQYSKEEYQKLVSKIKEHMSEMPWQDKKGRIYKYGEFFPIELSPFGYNESAAQDYFPLSKAEAKREGYPWSDYQSKIEYEFSDYKLPDDIQDVPDDVVDKILKGEVSGKAYKIIPQELRFYRKVGLPLPRKAPLQRHKERMERLPPRKLFQRECQKCGKQTQAVYAPDRPEVLYCKDCYQREMI